MKPTIPHPLGMHPRRIEVLTVASVDVARTFGGDDTTGATCRARWELGHFASDLVTAASPRWLAWAVSEALSGRLPRTQCYLAPVLTGGGEWDIGRGPVARPMVFGGDTCRPEWPDGEGCDDPDFGVLPEHDGLAPPRRPYAEDVGDVVFDDFESIDFPFIVVDEGATA